MKRRNNVSCIEKKAYLQVENNGIISLKCWKGKCHLKFISSENIFPNESKIKTSRKIKFKRLIASRKALLKNLSPCWMPVAHA
jgi:hypothetical protein